MADQDLVIRRARVEDLSAVVGLLADDPLGAGRENPHDLAPYRRAFAVIEADPHQFLAVAERDGRIVGTLQLTLVPGLSHQGAARAQIEAVRVSAGERGRGLGSDLIRWAVEQARAWDCRLVQLTSDKGRPEAHRFYERLGFRPTHEGFKLRLDT